MTLDELTDYMVLAARGDYAGSTRMMTECLRLVRLDLPPPGVAAIEVARRFWIDRALPASDLEPARVACWEFLDDCGASTNTTEPLYCAIRAIICVLYAEPPAEDLETLIGFFNEMMRGALTNEEDDAFVESMIAAVRCT